MKPKLSVDAAMLARFRAYRDNGNEYSGGSLHIMIADGNFASSHIRECIVWAKQFNDREGQELAELLLQMSRTQRRKIAAKWEEWDREGVKP